MKIEISENGVKLIREKGDKALSHESTVTHHIRRLLNEMGKRKWVRFYPCTQGLTGSTQGVKTADKKGEEIMYWDANYMIELAHKRYNDGSVFYFKV